MQELELPPPHLDMEALSRSRVPERSRGGGTVHLTDVIDHLDRLAHPRAAPAQSPDWQYAALLGFLWEDLWEHTLASQMLLLRPGVIRPGELLLDGVYCSPDGVAFEPEPPDLPAGRLVEYKFTWRSAKANPPASVWKWRVQCMAYCYVLGMVHCEINALYPLGNYRPPEPLFPRRLWTWEWPELADNWRMVLQGSEHLRREREPGIP